MTRSASGYCARSLAASGVSISTSPASRWWAMRMRWGAAGGSRRCTRRKRRASALGSTRRRPAMRLPRAGRADILENLFHAIEHALVGKALDAVLARGLAQLAAQALVAREARKRGSKRLRIARRHDERGALVH